MSYGTVTILFSLRSPRTNILHERGDPYWRCSCGQRGPSNADERSVRDEGLAHQNTHGPSQRQRRSADWARAKADAAALAARLRP